MSENSKIEWCDHTFNPWEGCTKVSPGCANCYAEARNRRFAGGENWGPGAPRRRTSAANWKQPLKWNRAASKANYFCRMQGQDRPHRPRVFCASLADWLDPEVPVEWLFDLLCLIHKTPHLDWLLLTKRAELWEKRMKQAYVHVAAECERLDATHDTAFWIQDWLTGKPPHNVWAGTSVESQPYAEKRVPELLNIPAVVHFISGEPLLGPVELGKWLYSDYDKAAMDDQLIEPLGGFNFAKINWVIVGGESGPNARPMHPDWAMSLCEQCVEAGVPFFFKQWGEWAPLNQQSDRTVYSTERSWWGPGNPTMGRYGKRAAGRLLDGQEWSEFPMAKEVSTP